MREFMYYMLESFRDATGWNRDNGFSNLNRTADELLDFQTPSGLQLSLSSLATPRFATSYMLSSQGGVDGSISYLYSSVPLANATPSSETVPLPTFMRSYRQLRELSATQTALGAPVSAAAPTNAFAREARKLVGSPTLLYGRLYLPISMLEALVIKRITPSVQVEVSAVSDSSLRDGGTVLGMMQLDRGRYGIEGLVSTDSGLLGLRGLYNFGGDASPCPAPVGNGTQDGGNGNGAERERIYGRFSAGGEIYYGTINKSGGVSLGVRFATLPAHRGTPLTATLTVNPLMGSISARYALVAREYCSLATKFGFNVYSYQSDWAVGMELWSKRRLAGLVGAEPASQPQRRERSFQAKMGWRLDEPGSDQAQPAGRRASSSDGSEPDDDEYHGVLKARLDQDLKIGLLWEGRMKALLFSLGTGVDLNKLDQPFRSVGLQMQFSS